jgi:hypothetical protein
MSRTADVYRDLPRAARWGLCALAALLAYFVVVEPVVDKTSTLNSRAQARAKAIAEVRSGGGAGAADLGLRQFGVVEPPGDARERAVALDRRVLEVLEKHSVEKHTSTTKTAPLASGPLLTALATANQKVDRRIREIQFEATPETLAAVIADLERAPEVAAVSRVQIRKSDDGGRTLRATVAAEAWTLVRKGASR